MVNARSILTLCLAICLTACDLTSSKPDAKIEHANQGVYDIKLTAKGDHAVVASIIHGGSLWRMKDKERIYNWNHAEGQYTALAAVAISGDGKIALTADGNRLVAWKTEDGSSVGFWNTPSEILSLALSADGQYALAGLKNFTAVYIEVSTGSILSTVTHQGKIGTVAISGDGGLGLTGSEDNTARLWRLKDGQQIRVWQHDLPVNLVALSNDGKLAFTASQSDKGILWDPKANKQLFTIPIRSTAFSSARFSKKGKQLLLGTTSRKTLLWNVKKKKQLQQWIAPRRSMWKPGGIIIYDVAFGKKKGQYYAAGSNGITYRWKSK